MSDDNKKGLGQAIMHGIIKDGLVTAVDTGLCSWSANAPETLEAIVADWHENSRFCESCENYVLIEGEADAEGIFVCNDCLGPEQEE